MSRAIVIPRDAVPAPRLQLRWEQGDGQGNFLCHYELVLPLREHDIRREVYDDDGCEIGEQSELVVAMNGPTRRNGNHKPCLAMNGDPTLYYDDPYRDGAHAKWDAEVLGSLPIFVVALDGTYLAKDSTP